MSHEPKSLAIGESAPRVTPGRMFAVLGPYRGGTSVVTGILHALGVFVGQRFFDGNTMYGTYEAIALRDQVLSCFDERPGRWRRLGSYSDRVSRLQVWATWAHREARCFGRPGAGGKHPVMCKLIPEIDKAWRASPGQPPVLIAVCRPEADVLRSWEQARTAAGDKWWPRNDRVEVTRDLIASRDAALASRSHVRVEFEELRADPREAIERLAAECDLPLENLEEAAKLVGRPPR